MPIPASQNLNVQNNPSFNTYWQAEILRLREAHWGPLEDAAEVRKARAKGQRFSERILLRASLLAQREKLDAVIQKYRHAAKIVLIAMLLIAVLTGAGAALSTLGDGTRSVNLMLALIAMLGLHSLTFVFWLLSFGVKNYGAGTWLGQTWLWITQKLARGPDAALTPRALVELLGRNNALRWVLGSISHSLWTAALLSLLFTLLAILSARRYEFNWETTLLTADTFVYLTTAIGWLPAHLGFTVPPEEIVRASNGLHTLDQSAQALWSGWLIGCLVVYGVIPRVFCLLLSLFMARKNIASLSIDENLPAYANLRERLQPTSETTGIDAPAGQDFNTRIQPHPLPEGGTMDQALLIGVELPPDAMWPPQTLPGTVYDQGIIDTRLERKALLDRLQQSPPKKLLAACDARQTPDRGTIAFLADLAGLIRQTHIALLFPPTANEPDTRTASWESRLYAAGFTAEQIHIQFPSALEWLEDEHDSTNAVR